MIRTPNQRPTRAQRGAGAVGERDARTLDPIVPGQRVQQRLIGEPPEPEVRPRTNQHRDLSGQKRQAVRAFAGKGPIVRRRAANGCREVQVRVAKAVSSASGRRLIRETRRMERLHQEGGGAVPGEHSPGSVRAVGRRGEADDHQARIGVAETWDGPGPVTLAPKLAFRCGRDSLPVPHEPRAPATDYDLAANAIEGIRPNVHNGSQRAARELTAPFPAGRGHSGPHQVRPRTEGGSSDR